MTKQEILDTFKYINFAYNDCSKHETLSRMLDELLEEQRWHVFYRNDDWELEVDCSPINQSAFLLFRKAANDMRVEVWDDDEYYEFGCIDGVEVEEGDAWMELPEPPKKGR